MKKQTFKIILLFLSSLVFIACSEKTLVNTEESNLKIEGYVFKSSGPEDIFTSVSAVSQAQVDVFKIDGHGNLEKLNSHSALTDSKGKYHVETEYLESKPFIISAQKDSKVWMGIVCPSANTHGVRLFAHPLTDVTTAQTLTFQNAVKKNYGISAYDISLLINTELTELIVANQDLTELVTDILYSSVNARTSAFKNSYFGGSAELLLKYYESAEKTQLLFARDIHFATSEDDIRELIEKYYQTYYDLFLDTGISKDKVLQLLEIYYRILILSNDTNPELKLRILKSSAYLRAVILNNSIISDFNSLQGIRLVGNIKSAAKTLKYSIKSASNYDNVKNSFTNYNKQVIDNLYKLAGINSGLRNSIEKQIQTDRNRLYADLNTHTDPESVINSYIKYYESVSPELKKLLKVFYSDDSDTLAELMILLYLDT